MTLLAHKPIALQPFFQFIDGKGFYTPKIAARLARIPRSTVSIWSRKGIVVPTLLWRNEEGVESIGYAFDALVFLRLIYLLRKRSLPLRTVVKAVYYLRENYGAPGAKWENARIFTDGHDVFIYHKNDWGVVSANRMGQKTSEELFGKEFSQLKYRADALLIPQRFSRYVEIDPSVKNGLPIIKQTAMQTATIHSLRLSGFSYEDITSYYPFLTRLQIRYSDSYEEFLDRGTIAA